MNGRRILFAISGADEEYANKALRVLRAHGLTELEEIEVVEGKNRILQCLDRFNDIAVVLVSQSQQNVCMQASDFDAFSTAGSSGERIVIPILKDDEYGTEYIASVCSLGLYHALYQKDATIENVAKLIQNGRGKAAAREYYGVSANHVIEQRVRGSAVTPVEDEQDVHNLVHEKKVTKKHRAKAEKHTSEQVVCGDYAVISTNVGVGCTFQTILMASALKKGNKGLKIAVLELDNAEQNMKMLCMQVLDRQNVHGISMFEVGGISYHFDTDLQTFLRSMRQQYDVVIYDVGCCDNETIISLKKFMKRMFVVSDVNEWHRGELAEFVKDTARLDRDRELVYLFPCVTEQIVDDAVKMLDGAHGYAIKHEGSVFAPSKDTVKLLCSLFAAKLPEKKYPSSLKIAKRIKSSSNHGVSRLWKITTGVSLCLAVIIGIRGKVSYNALYQQASASIMQANQNIDILNDTVASYQDAEKKMEKKVLRIKEDVVAGTEINWAIVDSVTIKSEEDQDRYLSVNDIEGKVFCVSLPANSILYDYMLVDVIEDEPPIMITIGDAVDENNE